MATFRAPPGMLSGQSSSWWQNPQLWAGLGQAFTGLGSGLLQGKNWGEGLGMGAQQAQHNMVIGQQQQMQREMFELEKKKLEKTADEDLVQAIGPDGNLIWMPKSQAAGKGSKQKDPFKPNIESITKGDITESGYMNERGEWVTLGSGRRFAPQQAPQPNEFTAWLQAFQRDNGRNPTAKEIADRDKRLNEAIEYKNIIENGKVSTLPVGPDLDAAIARGAVITGTTTQLTEAQGKAGMQFAVSKQANDLLDKAEATLTSPGDYIASQFGTVGNYAKSDEYRQAEQAARAVSESYLRAITGAAATDSEITRVTKTILPQPGDDPGTIAQKKAQRQTIVETLRLMSGSMAGQVDAMQQGGTAAPIEGGPAVGTVEDGFEFLGGNPADPNSWRKVP